MWSVTTLLAHFFHGREIYSTEMSILVPANMLNLKPEGYLFTSVTAGTAGHCVNVFMQKYKYKVKKSLTLNLQIIYLFV